MFSFFSKKEAKTIALLAVPVALAQLAQTSIGFVDTVVAGRAGAIDMAGVALGVSFWTPVLLFGQGMLMAITPLVAQALGAEQRDGLGRYLRQGLWMGLLLGLGILVVIRIIANLILGMNAVELELRIMAAGYLKAMSWGAPGMLLYIAARCFMEGHGRTRPAMLATITALIINVPLNFIFVFGWFGLPALGGVGCGVASAIIYWLMFLIMLATVWQSHRRAIRFEPLMGKLIARVARISFPQAMALLLEVLAFSIITILIAPLGALTVAGHQVAMQTSSMLFMLPLSLGVATTIKVGNYLGKGDLQAAKTARLTSLGMAVVISLLAGAFLILCRYQVASIYTADPRVLALAASLMFFTAVYQLPDYVQQVTMTALRGYNDTKAIFIIALTSYWLVGLSVGYTLAMTDLVLPKPMGVAGFWIGLIVGLTVAASLYLIRLGYLEKQPLAVIDAKIKK